MIKSSRHALFVALASALTLPTVAAAEGIYATGSLGYSQQASDSAPFGSNIAVDPDFPSAFDSGDGAVGTLGVGFRISERWRVEGRLGLRQASFNEVKFGTGALNGEEYRLDGDVKSTTLTLEGFYDIPTGGALKPYLKAGIGISRNRYSARLGGAGVAAFDPFDGVVDGYYDNYPDSSSTEFAWNLGFGGTYALTAASSLFAEYQYAAMGDVATKPDSFTDGFKIDDIAAHELMIGLRINF